MNKYFITGIGTDVGKTVISAILVEALGADYWKPVQAGDLDFTDTDRVRSWISNRKTVFHPTTYALNTPMSPHAAAEMDQVEIDLRNIADPETDQDLVIEGAGGLLVPLNNEETILDMIREDYKVIVVSRNYLGSINHTLLTLEALRSRGLEVAGLIFNGKEVPSTESIIELQGKVKVLGRIDEETTVDKAVIRKYAEQFKPILEAH
jgi:dethiobiotin synthetase